jgi:hypothetical protein
MADDEPTHPLEEPSPLEFCKDDDELRRAWIFGLLADPQIDGRVLVENMARVEVWLTTGAVEIAKDKPTLKVVNKKAAE